MSEQTGISWADSTFNPWMGCTKVSPACDHCYAERLMDHRMHKVQWGAGHARVRTSAANWQRPLAWERAAWRFVQCADCGERGPATVSHGTWRCGSCESPATVPARRRVFCASLADVFDNEAPPQWRGALWTLVKDTPNLDWLILTKRVGNAVGMAPADGFPPNVWLGITVVNQEEADRDIPKLLVIPARVRFLSIEPMLGPVALERPRPGPDLDQGGGRMICQPWLIQSGIDWVICGGESGPHARPMHPDWVRSLRDQCAAAGVPFHFKQWGEFLPADADEADPQIADVPESRLFWSDGSKWDRFDGQRGGVSLVARVGTTRAGRLLDDVEHNGAPA